LKEKRVDSARLLIVLCCMSCFVNCGVSGHGANAEFTANGVPGWTADRQTVLRRLGAPDEIETGPNPRPPEEDEPDGFSLGGLALQSLAWNWRQRSFGVCWHLYVQPLCAGSYDRKHADRKFTTQRKFEALTVLLITPTT
jgi:hypothetical protein